MRLVRPINGKDLRVSLCLLLAAFTLPASADDALPKPLRPTIPAAEAKRVALKWIADYRDVQVLFHDQDLATVLTQLEQASDEDALKWYLATATIRKALKSSEWKLTREWMHKFLKVQAIYSDEEIAALRDKANRAFQNVSNSEFFTVMAKVETMRSRLVQGAAYSRDLRQQQLNLVRAYREQEAAAAAAAAARALAATAPSSRTLPIGKARPSRSMPRPLINSTDAARFRVYNGLWRWQVRLR